MEHEKPSSLQTTKSAMEDIQTKLPSKYENGDKALDFLAREKATGVVLDITETKALRWKIDLRIMPFLMAIYFLQYLDKTLLNYAAVMGIRDNLKGNEFTNLGTIFYAGYLVAEPITSYLMQYFPIGKYLAVNIICWGITVACHAGCKSYASLMIVRVLLGIFEASVAPSLILITGMWWTKPEQSRRTGLWYLQIGVAQIIGAGISYGFQHVNSTKIANWQILFIFMGCLTVLVGIAAFFWLPDSPMEARFLNDQEKVAAIEHVRENMTGVENKTFKVYQVKELLFKDPQTWPLFFAILLAMVDNGAVSNFSSVIIASFGFSNKLTTIVQIPSGVISIIATLLATFYVGSYGHRCFVIAIVTIPSILGAGLLLGLPNSNKAGLLFGIYLLNSCPAMLPIIYTWNSANTSGYTKRVMRNGLTLVAFCIGNLIGPQMFQASDAPHYNPAKISLIAIMSTLCVFVVFLRQLVKWQNTKRDKEQETLSSDQDSDVDFAFADLTDIENRKFRYLY